MIMPATKIWTPEEQEAWRIPPRTLVSDWADNNRIIGTYAAESGPWRTERVPYTRAIMDAYIDPDVEEITITGPAQCAKTESVFNMIGYSIDVDPVPILYVTAREEDCDTITEDRLVPMLEDSPNLARHLTGRPWDLQKGKFMKLDRMSVYLAGAGSAVALSSKSIGVVILDEADKYKDHVSKEGSPIALAGTRTVTFQDARKINLCTLTASGGFMWQSLNRSNMQRYWMPCPLCGQYQDMIFFNLKVDPPGLRDSDYIYEHRECVYYKCKHCGGRIYEYQKPDMNDAGKWVPKGQNIILLTGGKSIKLGKSDVMFGQDGKEYAITGSPERSKRHSGFWVGGLISPWIYWHKMLAGWFEVNRNRRSDPGTYREFKNQTLAQVDDVAGQKTDASELKKQIGDFSKGMVPNGCKILVASADYHESERGIPRIDYMVQGFGYDCQNWVIKSGSVVSFDELDKEVLLEPFAWSDGTISSEVPYLAVMIMFVDCGYKPEKVFEYALTRRGIVWPVEGAPMPRNKPLTLTKLERPGPNTKKYRGASKFITDTCFFKDLVTGWAQPARDNDGNYIGEPLTEYYAEIPDYFFREFSNEQKVKEKIGRRDVWIWKPVYSSAPTHSLDLAAMCAAAAYYKGVHYWRDPNKKQIQPAAAEAAAAQQRPVVKTRRIRNGFLDNLPEL